MDPDACEWGIFTLSLELQYRRDADSASRFAAFTGTHYGQVM